MHRGPNDGQEKYASNFMTSPRKPPNWIPRDGLLARAVRLFRGEGHSQSYIGRELRLNRRTVSRLCAGMTNMESLSNAEPACAAQEIENHLQIAEAEASAPKAPEQPFFRGVHPRRFGWRQHRL
jgi:hypothetical protein